MSIFQVSLNIVTNLTVCTCKKFEMTGILCSHIFLILKNLDFKKIPTWFVLNRWCKGTASMLHGQFANLESMRNKDQSMILTELWSELHSCIKMAGTDTENLRALLKNVKQMKAEYEISMGAEKSTSKTEFFRSVIGLPQPEEINIKEPKTAKNKGRVRRIKSAREIGIEKAKNKRTCKICNNKVGHDARNCPLRNRSGEDQINDSNNEEQESHA